MTPADRRAVLLVVAVITLVWLLARVSAADSRQVPEWTVPPSAIIAITTAPGEQQQVGGDPARAGQDRGTDSAATAAASPRLPRGIGAEADHEAPTAPTAVPPTARPAASHSLAELVRVGIASTYGPGFGEAWVAIPQGPGWRIRVCGPGACRELVSTDKGPDQRLFPDRVVDLPVGAFEAICGVPWRNGLCSVQVVIEGRIR